MIPRNRIDAGHPAPVGADVCNLDPNRRKRPLDFDPFLEPQTQGDKWVGDRAPMSRFAENGKSVSSIRPRKLEDGHPWHPGDPREVAGYRQSEPGHPQGP